MGSIFRGSGSAFFALLMVTVAVPAMADGATAGTQITIEKGHFHPAELTLPAGKRVKVMVKNATALPAEFESNDFTVEKVIPGQTTLPVYIGPLNAGKYSFFNDFAQHMTGHIIVK